MLVGLEIKRQILQIMERNAVVTVRRDRFAKIVHY